MSWTKNFAVSSVAKNKEFTITNAKLYVPIVTLLTDDNVKLTKQLSERFKRSVYWNQYKTETKTTTAGNSNPKRMLFAASFQGVKRLFVIAFGNTENGAKRVKKKNSHQKYFLLRVNATNYKILIDDRNFYDQPIMTKSKKYDEIRKIEIRQGDDYTTGCLLYYQHFKDQYQLIAVNISKQK